MLLDKRKSQRKYQEYKWIIKPILDKLKDKDYQIIQHFPHVFGFFEYEKVGKEAISHIHYMTSKGKDLDIFNRIIQSWRYNLARYLYYYPNLLS